MCQDVVCLTVAMSIASTMLVHTLGSSCQSATLFIKPLSHSHMQDSSQGGQSCSLNTHDEHKPLIHVNSSEPSLSTDDVMAASGSGKKAARRQKHVHFSGTDSEDQAIRRPSSQSDQLPTKNYEVG